MRLPAIFSTLLLGIAVAVSAHSQNVKIDYSSYFGGSAADRGYAVAIDSAGATYIAGFTQSWDLPVIHAVQPYFAGGTGDLFVAKLKPDASGFEYITYIGGAGGDGEFDGKVAAIAVDKQGNAYVTGVTGSADFPVTPGAYQRLIGSQFECDDDPNAGLCGDAFVLKLSSSGSLVYSTFVGGSDYDGAKAIAVDSSGAAYVTGVTASIDFPSTTNTFRSQGMDVDAFVAKISSDGSKLLYSIVIGGTGAEAGMSVAVDGQGRASVAGVTQAPDFPLKNALQRNFGYLWDAYVLRVNATGTGLDFSTFLGGNGTDEAMALALDGRGDIYVAGYTDSNDFPVKNAFQPGIAGPIGSGFVTKLAGNGGTVLYSTFLGGADGTSELNSVTVDSSYSAYVGGVGGRDFPVVGSAQPYGGNSDAVVAKLTADGSGLLYSSFIGGSDADVASGIALDNTGHIVVIGQTGSRNFPLAGSAFQHEIRGLRDAFITKLSLTSSSGPIFSSPKVIPVGAMYVGVESAAGSIRVANPGDKSLAVSGVTSSGNVCVSSDCVLVAPGKVCSIAAQILADVPGEQSGTIMVYDNAPDSPQTIFVSGTAVHGGDLELLSLTIGNSFNYYGKTAVPITATLVNHGPDVSDDVVVRVNSDGGDASCDPCYVGRVEAGKSAMVRFNFVPDKYGMITVAVKSGASNASPDLNASNDAMTTTVANPRYQADYAELSFSQQIVNLTSDPQRITFKPLDQATLQLTFSTTGDFHASGVCDNGRMRCYADVTFTPSADGVRTGKLIVSEPVANTRQEIALSGMGVLKPHLLMSNSDMDFVDGVTGSPGTPQELTLTNDGSAPLFLVSITTDGNFAQTSDCQPSLAPGKSCTVFVSFITASPGIFKGSVTVVHNGLTMLDTVLLKGTGVPLADLARPGRPVVARSMDALVNREGGARSLDRVGRGQTPGQSLGTRSRREHRR